MTIFDAQRRRPRPLQLIPHPVERFGGLNLRDDPQEVGWQGALEMRDVTLDQSGRIRQRRGTDLFYTAPDRVDAIGQHKASGQLLLGTWNTGGGSATLRAISSAGASVATYNEALATPLTTGRASFASIGTMSGATEIKRSYATIDGIQGYIYRWDGAAWTRITTGSPGGGPLAVQPKDNRLAVAYESRVWFSNAGDPETFGTNDYVLLDPGDGERIVALAVFNDQLFAFKQSKFYVFYGNSTDSTGATVFNYRDVSAGVGVSYDKSSGTHIGYGAVAAKDGIYFFHDTGIYRTTGGTPELVSGELDPLFRGETSPHCALPAVASDSEKAMTVLEDDVFASYLDTGGNYKTLVYNTRRGGWAWYNLAAAVLGAYDPGTGARLAFSRSLSAAVYRYGDPSLTDDAGSPITSTFRTGFSDLGVPGAEKILREVLIDGKAGSVGVSVVTNDSSTVPSATTVVLNATAVVNSRYPKAHRGRNFSIQIGSLSGGHWSVSRVVGHHLAERDPGADST